MTPSPSLSTPSAAIASRAGPSDEVLELMPRSPMATPKSWVGLPPPEALLWQRSQVAAQGMPRSASSSPGKLARAKAAGTSREASSMATYR